MSFSRILALVLSVAGSGQPSAARAEDAGPDAPVRANGGKIKMDEPMTTGMMKDGMVKGDVKAAAEKKAEKMQPMIEHEETAMPQVETPAAPDAKAQR